MSDKLMLDVKTPFPEPKLEESLRDWCEKIRDHFEAELERLEREHHDV